MEYIELLEKYQPLDTMEALQLIESEGGSYFSEILMVILKERNPIEALFELSQPQIDLSDYFCNEAQDVIEYLFYEYCQELTGTPIQDIDFECIGISDCVVSAIRNSASQLYQAITNWEFEEEN